MDRKSVTSDLGKPEVPYGGSWVVAPSACCAARVRLGRGAGPRPRRAQPQPRLLPRPPVLPTLAAREPRAFLRSPPAGTPAPAQAPSRTAPPAGRPARAPAPPPHAPPPRAPLIGGPQGQRVSAAAAAKLALDACGAGASLAAAAAAAAALPPPARSPAPAATAVLGAEPRGVAAQICCVSRPARPCLAARRLQVHAPRFFRCPRYSEARWPEPGRHR